MKKFLKKVIANLILLVASFFLVAIAARFVGPINWFFFQKNEHDRVFYTLLETEKAIAQGKQFDVLVLGSSTCENAVDPAQFTALTGLSVFKFVTGAQTINISARAATYLAPKFNAKYILIDGYPRYGADVTEEGIERIVINSPDANTPLTKTILGVDPSSLTTDYLWVARAIGTLVKPYDSTSIIPKPHEFNMLAPGFTSVSVDPPADPGEFEFTPYPYLATGCLNELDENLTKNGYQMVLFIPPLQNALVRFVNPPKFPVINMLPRPDTCFFDRKHLRQVCVEAFTLELAEQFNRLRKQLPTLQKTSTN
jgi:hypothetical protein